MRRSTEEGRGAHGPGEPDAGKEESQGIARATGEASASAMSNLL